MLISNKHGELQIMLIEAAIYTDNYIICRSLLEVYSILSYINALSDSLALTLLPFYYS